MGTKTPPAFEAALREKHFRIEDVNSDGNCFYRALSLCFTGTESNYHWYRLQITNYMQAHMKAQVSQVVIFFDGDSESFLTNHRVSHRLRLAPNVQRSQEGRGEFAGDVNIVAASWRFGVDITLHNSLGGDQIQVRPFRNPAPAPGKPQVHIGRYNDNHFVLLRPVLKNRA